MKLNIKMYFNVYFLPQFLLCILKYLNYKLVITKLQLNVYDALTLNVISNIAVVKLLSELVYFIISVLYLHMAKRL